MVKLPIRLVRASAELWAMCPCHGLSFGHFMTGAPLCLTLASEAVDACGVKEQ